MSNNKLAKLIIEKLQTPTDWRIGQHTVTHIPSGVEVWTANGKRHLSIWRGGRTAFPISFFERRQMWKLIKAIPEPEDRDLAAAYAALNAIEINPPAAQGLNIQEAARPQGQQVVI